MLRNLSILLVILICQISGAGDYSAEQLLKLVDVQSDRVELNAEGQKRYPRDASAELLKKDLQLLYSYKPTEDRRSVYNWFIENLEFRLYSDRIESLSYKLNDRLGELKFDPKKVFLADLSLDETPELDGATSTLPMRKILMGYFFGVKSEWARHIYMPEINHLDMPSYQYQNNIPRYQTFRQAKPKPRLTVRREILLTGEAFTPNSYTGKAYQRLLENPNTVVINSVSPEDVAALTEKDFKVAFDLDDLIPHSGDILPRESLARIECKIIAYDALVAIAHVSNPIDNITLEQIRKIYTSEKQPAETPGNFTSKLTWKDINKKGAPSPIMPLGRNPNSGTGILMRKLLFQGLPSEAEKQIHKSLTMNGIFDMLGSNKAAIGFSVFYFEQNINPMPYSKNLAINGIMPSNESIADGSYPLRAPIYAAIRRDEPAGSPARRIYDFLSTPEGQTVIEASGYVSAREAK